MNYYKYTVNINSKIIIIIVLFIKNIIIIIYIIK